jgi:hypothetical protein
MRSPPHARRNRWKVGNSTREHERTKTRSIRETFEPDSETCVHARRVLPNSLFVPELSLESRHSVGFLSVRYVSGEIVGILERGRGVRSRENPATVPLTVQ